MELILGANFGFTLETIAALGLFADHIQNRVDQFCPLSVMALGPIVSRSGLSENEIVRTKSLGVKQGDKRELSWNHHIILYLPVRTDSLLWHS